MAGGIMPSHTDVGFFFQFSSYIFSAGITPEILKLGRVTKVKLFFLYVFIIWRRVFYWELSHSQIPYATSSGSRGAYFPYVTFVMYVRMSPFAFVQYLVSI